MFICDVMMHARGPSFTPVSK